MDGLEVPHGVQLERDVVALQVTVDEARTVNLLKTLCQAQGQDEDVLEQEATGVRRSGQMLLQRVFSAESHEESQLVGAEAQGLRGTAGPR